MTKFHSILFMAGVIVLGSFFSLKDSPRLGAVSDADFIKQSETLDFDIRKDDELAEMIVSHEAKLPEVTEEFNKFTECPECIRYEARKFLEEHYGDEMTPAEITAEVEKQFTNKQQNAEQEFNTLTEAITVMKKEQQFRAEGKVIRDNPDVK